MWTIDRTHDKTIQAQANIIYMKDHIHNETIQAQARSYTRQFLRIVDSPGVSKDRIRDTTVWA